MSERSPKPGDKRIPSTHRDSEGRKLCTNCLRYKEESEFQRGSAKDGLQSHCEDCVYFRGLRRKHGLSKWDWVQLVSRTGGCGICGSLVSGSPHTDRLSVDHDHSCCPDYNNTCGSCVRGVLCHSCNLGLGYFKDSKELLTKAMDYLGSSEGNT